MSDFMNLLIGDTKKEIADTEKRLNELKKFHNIINPKSSGGRRKTKIEIVPFPKEIMAKEVTQIRESVSPNIYTASTKGFKTGNKSRKNKIVIYE